MTGTASKRTKTIGSGITARTVIVDVASTPQEMISFAKAMTDELSDPWAAHRRCLDVAREGLKQERAGKPDGYAFKPREDAGWYFHRLVMLGGLVEQHIDRGDAAWAAHEAAIFGETWCELRMKIEREELFLYGAKARAQRAAGAASVRRQPQAERVAQVRELLDEGRGLRNAFGIVGRRYGVSPKTIERDWYSAKKTS